MSRISNQARRIKAGLAQCSTIRGTVDDRRRSYFIAGTEFPAPPLQAGLHVVATPIGNLKDITIRALETLAAADLILCEDTRHSATLLDHYGIRTPKKSLHEHNERARIGRGGARRSAPARPSRRFPTPARRCCRTPAFRWCAACAKPGSTCSRCPAPRRCWRRWRLPGCLPMPSALSAFCRPRPGPAAMRWRRSRRAPTRWCSTSRRAGSTIRLPPWPRRLARTGRPPWRWS